MRFKVKGKPVGKERPRFSRYSGAYTASRTRDYEAKVAVACKSKMRELGLKLTYEPCKVHIDVMVKVPKSYTKKRRIECINGVELPTKTPDIDNIVKSIMDGMQNVFYDDDKQVVIQSAIKEYWDHEDAVYVDVSEVRNVKSVVRILSQDKEITNTVNPASLK